MNDTSTAATSASNDTNAHHESHPAMTTTTTPADAFEYVTAAELRAMLDDTPHPDELDEALVCLPIDIKAFHTRMTDAVANRTAASLTDAVGVVREAVQACALPGHVISDDFAALIDRAITTTGQLRKAAAAHDRAALLVDIAEAIRTRDAAGLAVALGMAPFSIRAYADRMGALDDATDPERLRAEQVRALKASATPGTVLDDELAGAILDALNTWHAIKTETPAQKAIREAFTEARLLIDLHGEDDPRAFAAIVHAVNMQNPEFIDEALRESGIHMPKPDRCTDDGTPLYSLEAVADALGADPEELLVKAREMEAHGLGVLHTDNANTHTLQ